MKKILISIFAAMLICNANAQTSPVKMYSDNEMSVKFGFSGTSELDGVFVFIDAKKEYCELAYMLPAIIVGVVFTDDTYLRLYKIPELSLSDKNYDETSKLYHTDYLFFCDDAKQLFTKKIKRLVSVKNGGGEFNITIDARNRVAIQQGLRAAYNKFKSSAK